MLVTGPNFITKLYYDETSKDSDLIEEAALYAQHTVTIDLTAAYWQEHILRPSSLDVSNFRLAAWLALQCNAYKLRIDSFLHSIIEKGHEFLWTSIRHIQIKCRAHAETVIDDDIMAVTAVSEWLLGPLSSFPVHVELTGHKWQPDTLPLSKLRSSSETFVDNRIA